MGYVELIHRRSSSVAHAVVGVGNGGGGIGKEVAEAGKAPESS